MRDAEMAQPSETDHDKNFYSSLAKQIGILEVNLARASVIIKYPAGFLFQAFTVL